MKKPSQLRLFLIMSTIACIIIFIIAVIFYFNFIKISLFGDGLYYIDILYMIIFFTVVIYIFKFNTTCAVYKIEMRDNTFKFYTLLNPVQIKREDILIVRNNISTMVIKPKNKRRKLFIFKRLSNETYINLLINKETLKNHKTEQTGDSKIKTCKPMFKLFVIFGTIFFIFGLTFVTFFVLLIAISGQLDLVVLLCFLIMITGILFILQYYTFKFILKVEVNGSKIAFQSLWHKTEASKEDDISIKYGMNTVKIYISYKNGKQKKFTLYSIYYDNEFLELIKDFIYNR